MASLVTHGVATGIFGAPSYQQFSALHHSYKQMNEEHSNETSETESSNSSSIGTASAADLTTVFGSQEGHFAKVAPARGKLPDFAVPLQPKLLKQINSFNTKEELLQFVGQCHGLLDTINLVTCLYRLAKLYASIHSQANRQTWRLELCQASTFHQLIGTLQLHVTEANMHPGSQEARRFDSRCVSNLIWSITKLDLAQDGTPIIADLVVSLSPLVIKTLPNSSGQGLANLLWAYAKLPSPPINVMVMVVKRMQEMMEANPSLLDAQALSNSVWALAHTRMRVCDLDAAAGHAGSVIRFLSSVAHSVCAMLGGLHQRLNLSQLQAFLSETENKFSCQALVNIAWSFASIISEECGRNAAVRAMFMHIRQEAVVRLRATASALQVCPSWVYRSPGGFNEQALSNTVYAFEKAHMLDPELLSWVFTVATLRLDRRDEQPAFKPQELCTLLRAAHLPVAQPIPFLAKLATVVSSVPWIINTWSQVEVAELKRAFNLLHAYAAVATLPGPAAALDLAVAYHQAVVAAATAANVAQHVAGQSNHAGIANVTARSAFTADFTPDNPQLLEQPYVLPGALGSFLAADSPLQFGFQLQDVPALQKHPGINLSDSNLAAPGFDNWASAHTRQLQVSNTQGRQMQMHYSTHTKEFAASSWLSSHQANKEGCVSSGNQAHWTRSNLGSSSRSSFDSRRQPSGRSSMDSHESWTANIHLLSRDSQQHQTVGQPANWPQQSPSSVPASQAQGWASIPAATYDHKRTARHISSPLISSLPDDLPGSCSTTEDELSS